MLAQAHAVHPQAHGAGRRVHLPVRSQADGRRGPRAVQPDPRRLRQEPRPPQHRGQAREERVRILPGSAGDDAADGHRPADEGDAGREVQQRADGGNHRQDQERHGDHVLQGHSALHVQLRRCRGLPAQAATTCVIFLAVLQSVGPAINQPVKSIDVLVYYPPTPTPSLPPPHPTPHRHARTRAHAHTHTKQQQSNKNNYKILERERV